MLWCWSPPSSLEPWKCRVVFSLIGCAVPHLFQGENLDLAISKDEVMAMIGEGICVVKTLTRNHLYCEPPSEQPAPRHRAKREGTDLLPEFTVGNQQYCKKSCHLLKQKQEVVVEAGSGMGSGGEAEALVGIRGGTRGGKELLFFFSTLLLCAKHCLKANGIAGFGSCAVGQLC